MLYEHIKNFIYAEEAGSDQASSFKDIVTSLITAVFFQSCIRAWINTVIV